jgi:hypothetical protein
LSNQYIKFIIIGLCGLFLYPNLGFR